MHDTRKESNQRTGERDKDKSVTKWNTRIKQEAKRCHKISSLCPFVVSGGGSRQEGRKAWKKKRGVSRMEAIVYDNSWPLAARRDALVGVVSRETTEWRAYLRKRRNQ